MGQQQQQYPHLAAAREKIRSNESFRVENLDNITSNHPVGMREFLHQQWNQATLHWRLYSSKSDQHDDDETLRRWFERLLDLHTQPSRHYHTIVHLWEMLSWVEAFEQDGLLLKAVASSSLASSVSTVSTALGLATFFHDSIYDPTSQENERKSAQLWDEFCGSFKDTVPPAELQKMVRILILATEKHQVMIIDNNDGPATLDMNLLPILQAIFLDIDMAVLGKSWSAYLSYASLIRQEYRHVPATIYCQKRAEILFNFCFKRKPQSSIYLFPIFQQLLEDQAKENLQAEIELLNKGIIPGELCEEESTVQQESTTKLSHSGV
jgi:predicted metal-dependent HD superfamily phosphohydrolase